MGVPCKCEICVAVINLTCKCHAQAVAARLARPVEEMARCLKGVVFAYW